MLCERKALQNEVNMTVTAGRVGVNCHEHIALLCCYRNPLT